MTLQRGQVVAELLEESWDEDPEARLTAANILHRLELLQDVKPVPQSLPLAVNREEVKPTTTSELASSPSQHSSHSSLGNLNAHQ